MGFFGKKHNYEDIFFNISYTNQHQETESRCCLLRVFPENRQIFEDIANVVPDYRNNPNVVLGSYHFPIYVTKKKYIVKSIDDLYCALVQHLLQGKSKASIDVYVPYGYHLSTQ